MRGGRDKLRSFVTKAASELFRRFSPSRLDLGAWWKELELGSADRGVGVERRRTSSELDFHASSSSSRALLSSHPSVLSRFFFELPSFLVMGCHSFSLVHTKAD